MLTKCWKFQFFLAVKSIFFFFFNYIFPLRMSIFYLEQIVSLPYLCFFLSLSTIPFNSSDYWTRLARCLHIRSPWSKKIDHVAYEMIACKYPLLVKFHAWTNTCHVLIHERWTRVASTCWIADEVSFFGWLSIPTR